MRCLISMVLAFLLLVNGWSAVQAKETAADPDSVKIYLLKTLGPMKSASANFLNNARTYAAVIERYHGDYEAAYRADADRLRALVEAMRENYKTMDSYGYEAIEGIVAGVEPLAAFDVYLDAGVPQKDASAETPAAPVVLSLANGKKIDREGCLFTFIIEPMLWNGNVNWCVPTDLNGDGKIGAREGLPRAEVLAASAKDVDREIGELITTAEAWKPSDKECFDAVIAMTPTLSGYFEDWKESRYSDNASGLFTAVSRVSDMKGIMTSVRMLYTAVDPLVVQKDAALARSIKTGFTNILQFVDRVGTREAAGKLTIAEIDEMARQATEKADTLVPQVEQAAALVGARNATR